MNEIDRKKALRKYLLEKRREFREIKGSAFKKERDDSIFNKIISVDDFKKTSLVLTYVSTEIEVDTLRLIDFCLENYIPVAVPGIVDEEMRFFSLIKRFEIGDEITFNTNGTNNTNKKDDSICVVPALSFNRDGYRLGYGGGYYDRFLRKYNGLKIGICYDEFITDIPVEPHDEKVDKVITQTL